MTKVANADFLLSEYENLVAKIGDDAPDDQIVAALVSQHDWTELGARAIVTLARTYGSFVLRNAYALAGAMQIEDGSSRL